MSTDVLGARRTRSPRIGAVVLLSALVGLLAGIGATSLVLGQPTTEAHAPAGIVSDTGIRYGSADAAERWLSPGSNPADLHPPAVVSDTDIRYGSADAAERWLTPDP